MLYSTLTHGSFTVTSSSQPWLTVVVVAVLVLVPVPVLVPVAVDVVLLAADGGHSIMNVELAPVPAITVAVLLG